MKMVVAGGHGLVGAKLVTALRARGHEVLAASRRSGVDTVTGEGLAQALAGAQVVVDVTNAPVFEDPQVTEFFRRSSEHLLAASASAGVGHYLALSVVGTARLQGSAYFRAKAVQEQLLRQSALPHTLVQATQFYEFMASIIPPGAGSGAVHLSPAQVQPIAADDVAQLLADLAEQPAAAAAIEVAGPEPFRLCELVQWVMYSYQDERPVVADADARYYGARLDDRVLTPHGQPVLGTTFFRDWLDGYLTGFNRIPPVHLPHPLG